MRTVPADERADREGHPAVLCVNNLSSAPQAARLQLPEPLSRAVTVDLFGGHGFPDIAEDGSIELALGSRTFYWLGLTPDEDA